MIILGLIILLVGLLLIYFVWREVICIYRNPFPLFHNGDKRFSEIVKYKGKKYVTRSVLKDSGYETK